MEEIVEFSKEKLTNEEEKLLIEQSIFLQYCLKIMNDIPLLDETPVDYMELWNKIKDKPKIEFSEVNSEKVAFYFNLLTTGIDNFGQWFIAHLAKSENINILMDAVNCLLAYCTDVVDREMKENKEK